MKVYLITEALITWFAVILQLYLIIINRVASISETIIRFFSFYTILTNILVALFFTIILFKPASRLYNFFSRNSVATAIALYITIVGIVYNLILRNIWSPTGLQQLADELLHVIVPLLFIFYWFIFVSKQEIEWKNILSWLVYPLVYLIFVLLRGSVSHFYPYPFIDVNLVGYSRAFLNSLGVLILFLFVSILFILIAKTINKRAL